MKCEHCNQEHEGTYGSGRFCTAACARAFSTAAKRQEINVKVSQVMRGQVCTGRGFDDTTRHTFTEEDRQKAADAIRVRYAAIPFEERGRVGRKNFMFEEQDGCCLSCGNSEWMGQPIPLDMHHVDGDSNNNTRENLQLLCPNCHSLTDTWKGKNYNKSSRLERRDYYHARVRK